MLNMLVAISALALTFVASAASAATGEKIGAAVRVVNDVKGEIGSAARPLVTGDGVQQDETIAAAVDSLAELRLDDSSKVAIGSGSRLVLDKFVYDPSAKKGSISINLVLGAFRFMTGVASKKDYLIKTPTAVIAVRGTIFDVYVASDGTTYILLHEGSITACNRSGQCARVDDPCGVVRVGNDIAPRALHGFNRLVPADRPDFATAFPFVVTPPTIDPEPRFTRIAIEGGTCTDERENPTRSQHAEGNPTQRYATIGDRQPLRSKEPVAASVYNGVNNRPWSGGYAGIVVGAIWQTSDPYLDCDDFTVTTGICSSAVSAGIPSDAYKTGSVGFLGGGDLGYNFQFGNFVVGGEADIAYADININSRYDQVFTFPPPCACVVVRGSFVRQELNSLSTVRGRLGYAFGNVLVYGTGGLAIGQVDYKFEFDLPDVDGKAVDHQSKLALGYTGGAGVEIRFGDWSLKTEYLYYDLGQETLNAPLYIGGAYQQFNLRPKFETEGHILRIGTNYHFD
jgi:opacity protein-like surface antigen